MQRIIIQSSREKLDLVIKDDSTNSFLEKDMDYEKMLGKLILGRLQLFS